jgi:crossover junction endodeoxyribonuclease RuvC
MDIKKKYAVIIGIDPGVSGGISVIEKGKCPVVYKMPVVKILINKKTKNIYDLDEIVNILSQHINKNVLFVQESVSAMSGQGVTSSFNFGWSAGATLGIASAFRFDRYEVRPALWKKHFGLLTTPIVQELKDKSKALKILSKTIKDKDLQKSNKKELEKINRQIKTEAKNASREIASSKYPELSYLFEKKNSDGLAESLLIAMFGEETKCNLD